MQRRRVLIVDGYNVIRNNKRYEKFGVDFSNDGTWNAARETLINDAALYAKGLYESCTVVFDGAGNPQSSGSPERVAGIEVIFSPTGVSADTIIEKLAFQARESGMEAVVVSSDLTIQSTVFGGGVTRMSSMSFASTGEVLEEEWHEDNPHAPQKNTVADRIDPKIAEKLAALVRSK